MEKTGIADRSAEKAAMMKNILKQKEAEKNAIDTLSREGRLDLGALDTIEPFARHAILRWLTKALQDDEYIGITEYGVKYRILNPKTSDRCIIKSTDGDLLIPAFVIDFEVKNERG